jgi:hypothetical protein
VGKLDNEGSMWLSEGSKMRAMGYRSKNKEVHDKDPLKEPVDVEVSMNVGQGLKNGRLWIGDGCIHTSSIYPPQQAECSYRDPPAANYDSYHQGRGMFIFMISFHGMHYNI